MHEEKEGLAVSSSDPYGQRPPADQPPSGGLPQIGYQAVDPLTGQPLSAAGGPDYLGYSSGQNPSGPIPQGQYPRGQVPADRIPQGQVPPGYPAAAAAPALPPVAYPPGYVPGGQVPAGYPAQPGYAAAPVYGAPGYPMYQQVPGYGYPMMPVGPRRPGSVTAAAVLAFIQGGLALIGGITTLSGASEIYGTFQASELGSELTMLGFAMLLAGGLLIGGGAVVLSRRAGVLIAGALISLGVSIYLVVRIVGFPFGSTVIWLPIMYAVLPIIAMALVAGSDAKAWARRN